MYGYIYITTNLVNGKQYIGQHTSDSFDEFYKGSGKVFLKALKKYGALNFETKILKECFSKEELDNEEIKYIAEYNAVEDKNFYNTSFGGGRNTKNLKWMYNKDLDKSLLSAECHIDYWKSKGYELGMRPHSKESIERYKEAKKDKIPITNGNITKYINSTDLIPEGWRKGRDKPTRPNQKSEKRRWMNKNGKSIMIKGEDVQTYLNDGYEFGRTYFEYHRDFDKNPVWNKGKKIGNKCKPKKTP